MLRPNPSHTEDWLDTEINSLVRSLETGEKLEPPKSGAPGAFARWFGRPVTPPELPRPQAIPPRRLRRRSRPRLWARARHSLAMHRGDLGLYVAGIVASAIVGWLMVVLDKP
jgi:hypothetical protein